MLRLVVFSVSFLSQLKLLKMFHIGSHFSSAFFNTFLRETSSGLSFYLWFKLIHEQRLEI